MPHDDPTLARAADWAVRAGDPAFDEWDAFTAWLAESPAHAEAYDRVAAAVADAAELTNTAPVPANDEPLPLPQHRRRWYAGAIAASLAVVLAAGYWQLRDDRYTVATAPGQTRTVALGGGGRIDLAGGTRLVLDHRDARFASLEEGQALFTIRHDPARTLSIAAGGLRIGDIGTRFEVQTNGSAVRVEVSEGRVELRGEALGDTVDLPAGRRMLFDPTHKLAVVAPVSPRDVGEWREGRLSYDAAPLSLVAADLARYAGISVTVPPPLAGRRFSGTLSIHNGDNAVRDLAQLMGLQLSGHRGAYRLAASG